MANARILMALLGGLLPLHSPLAGTTNRVLASGPPSYSFSPAIANIEVGDTILWTNVSSTSHDVTQGSRATGVNPSPYWARIDLQLFGRGLVTFSNVGTYPYICNQHVFVVPQPNAANPTQTGVVNVSTLNLPPQPVITSPAEGTRLLEPATLTLSASASDPDGSVTNLQLFIGSNMVASATTSPLSATVTGLPGGNYKLTARAVDNQGKTNVSAPVNVAVSYRVDYFSDAFSPAVLQIKPTESILFTNIGGAHTVSGTGTDPFCGSAPTPIQSCSVTFSNAGTFPYVCVFHSAFGMTGLVSVVSTFNRRPLAVMTSPASDITVPAGQNVTLKADAFDPDGFIGAVRFRNGTTPLFTDTTFPFSYTMTNPPPGVYVITALAADNGALQSTSAPVTITVVAQTDLRLSDPAISAEGFRFNYNAEPGQRYVVEGSANPDGWTPFVPIVTNTAGGNVVTFIDPTPATRNSRVYRVFRQP